ncbi:hypothetical protein FD755_022229, partial [Muntiacus reevesi]
GATGSAGGASGDSTKGEGNQDWNKERKEALSKEQLQEHLQPMPEQDYFFSKDTSSQEDIILFSDHFDGQEYPAIVEFAPFQKPAKKKTNKKDTDPEYRKFLERYATDNEKMTSTPETLLEEIEAKNRELIAKKATPLLSFLKNKQKIREEQRWREIERKRQREGERRKWKEEEKQNQKDIENQIKDMKKTWTKKLKKLAKENLSDERASGQSCTLPRSSEGEFKDEKPKRSEDENQELILRERERLKRQEEEICMQKERYEKEKACKRKEEEMKKEKEDRPVMQLYQPGQESVISHRKEGSEE